MSLITKTKPGRLLSYAKVGSELLKLFPRPVSNFVKVVEVGPRDGLQNINKTIPTDIKIEMIDKLSECGFLSIEAASFVSPKWIPQLADGKEVLAGIKKSTSQYPVLVPNIKGLERALECGVTEISIFTAASETFCRKNTNCTISESFEKFEPVFVTAAAHNVKVRGYVSCVVGCPYEGHIDPIAVSEVSEMLLKLGCYEVSLGDTIGVGTPGSIKAMLDQVLARIAPVNVALHCHDTYGQALANCLVGLHNDIRVFDSSVSGLGGCPYAKGASGNVATEDLIFMLHGSGFETGINLDKVIETGYFISEYLGRQNQSKVGCALGKASS